jgi:hypothetical protein
MGGSAGPPQRAQRRRRRRRRSAFRRARRATSIRLALPRARPRAGARPRHLRGAAGPAVRIGRAWRRHAPPTGRTFRYPNRAEPDAEAPRPARRRHPRFEPSAEPTPSTFPASSAVAQPLAQRSAPIAHRSRVVPQAATSMPRSPRLNSACEAAPRGLVASPPLSIGKRRRDPASDARGTFAGFGVELSSAG